MTDLETLRELCEWMGTPEGGASLNRVRAAGVASVRVGQLEMHLGPPVPPSLAATDSDLEASPPTQRDPVSSPDDDERNALETLLHSSGADADAFFQASKAARSRLLARTQQ